MRPIDEPSVKTEDLTMRGLCADYARAICCALLIQKLTKIDEIAIKINDITLKVDEIAVKINELTIRINEIAMKINQIAIQLNEITVKNNEIAIKQMKSQWKSMK